MNLRLLLLALLLSCHACEGRDGATNYRPAPIDTPYAPGPIDIEHPTLTEALDLPGDALAATIVTPADATLPEVLAAQEVRRYVYLRTGVLLPLRSADELPDGDVLLVATQAASVVDDLESLLGYVNPPGGFLVKSVEFEGRTVLAITGADPDATLHGAYRFAEHLGVGFGLEGDAIPDVPVALELGGHDEVAVPVLETRGLLPFHDFPEGPDFWDTDDYLLVMSQMPKLGLNFIGFHNYPRWSSTEEAGLQEHEGGAPQGPEPTVWIGQAEDIGEGAEVTWSYPAYYAHTARPELIWGFRERDTDAFHGGTNQLFDRNAYGSDVMGDAMPTDVESSNAVFERTGMMLRTAFGHAQRMGIRTALGIELPLGLESRGPEVGADWVRGMPPALQRRLQDQGLDPADPDVVRSVYEGIFQRIMQTHHLDIFWLWSWEVWSWHGVNERQIRSMEADIALAFEAAARVDAPFELALGGWIVGSADDPALFDRMLPSDVPFFGLWDGALGFEHLHEDRVKWPGTWLEEDWGLAQPQLVLRRLHDDVTAALDKSCDGVIAKHWRTRILGASVHAYKDLTWSYGTTASGVVERAVDRDRDAWIEATYLDWAVRQFGVEAGPAAARILASLDQSGEGGLLPTPLGFGPAEIQSSRDDDAAPETWSEAREDYRFVDDLEAIEATVVGEGNRERFAYWLASFQILRLMGQYSYERASFELLMEEEAYEAALESRRRLARLWEELMGLAAQKATNSSDLGEIVNLEVLNWLELVIVEHGAALEEGLGRPLPDDADPSREYAGPSRLVVTPARTMGYAGESLVIDALVLGETREVVLHHRPLGVGAFEEVTLDHRARGAWSTTLPTLTEDLEYYVEADTSDGIVVWPAAAPALTHTVVVIPFERTH